MTDAIRGFDHVVVMAGDFDRSLAFYRDVLGGRPRFEAVYLDGRLKSLPIVLGGAVINLQKVDDPAHIVANRIETGTVDVCFRWDDTIEAAVRFLAARGVKIVEGPVPRCAANGVWGLSVYFRDPDGNLLEFLSTAEPSEPLFTE